ncbi:MAG: Lrp/AsnC family transcriptional regulator [Nanoarchaeota archaeon]
MTTQREASTHRLVSCLRKDARASLSSIARLLGVPITTIHARYRRLRNGVILRHTVLLDHWRLGIPYRVFFFFEQADESKVRRFIDASQHVNSVHRCDVCSWIIDAYFEDKRQREKFTNDLQGISRELMSHEVIELVRLEGMLCGHDSDDVLAAQQ